MAKVDDMALKIARLVDMTAKDSTTLVRNNYDIVRERIAGKGKEDATAFEEDNPRYGIPMHVRMAIYTCELIKRGELKE